MFVIRAKLRISLASQISILSNNTLDNWSNFPKYHVDITDVQYTHKSCVETHLPKNLKFQKKAIN